MRILCARLDAARLASDMQPSCSRVATNLMSSLGRKNMFRKIAVFVVLGIALGNGVARAQSVKTDYDPKVNFSAYRTYYWATTDPTPNDLMNRRIIAAVDQWLMAKGWIPVPPALADVAVSVHVATKERYTLQTFYDGWPSGWGVYGWGTATTEVIPFVQGTMVVDLFDARTKRLIWRGIATDTISDDPQKNAKKIEKAVEKMFKKNFPPAMKVS
jgi:uncharacterized protein DUF4136